MASTNSLLDLQLYHAHRILLKTQHDTADGEMGNGLLPVCMEVILVNPIIIMLQSWTIKRKIVIVSLFNKVCIFWGFYFSGSVSCH